MSVQKIFLGVPPLFYLQVTFYVAEFWNTLSNAFIVVPPIFGLLEARRHVYESRWGTNPIFYFFLEGGRAGK